MSLKLQRKGELQLVRLVRMTHGSNVTALKDRLLRCAPNLQLLVRSPGDIRLSLSEDVVVDGGGVLLEVVRIFAVPTTIAEGLAQLKHLIKDGGDWVRFSSLLTELHGRGFLLTDEAFSPLGGDKSDYGAAPVHNRMLNDLTRTQAFQSALRKVVKRGDVVLEIGCGSGVLSVTAVQSGAKKVYAFEQTTITRLAAEVFKANGVAEQIELISGSSTNHDLPEKADVLVAELLGNDPLGESILPVTADAVSRHLKAGAELIPRGINLYGLLVEIPTRRFENHVVTPNLASRWKSELGIDFSPMEAACRQRSHFMEVGMQTVRDWKALAPPQDLLSIDLRKAANSPTHSKCRVTITEPGVISGIAIYFDAELCDGVRLSLKPDEVSETNHWASRIWIPPMPVKVKPGDQFDLSYDFGPSGSSFELTPVR